jgi:hypothetical protein
MKNKLLILAMGFALTTQMIMAQVPSYVPTNGLVGYWPFNGNANDESGNGNNGVVNGATLSTDRFGNVNSSFSFNGQNQRIDVPTNNQLYNTSFSVSCFFRLDQVDIQTNAAIFISSGQGSPNNGLYIGVNGNANNYFGFFDFYSNQLYSSNPLSVVGDNTWHHFVATYNKTNGQRIIYLDNLIIGSDTSASAFFGTGQSSFGITTWNLVDDVTGKLDDIGIWNRALSEQEITNLYNSANTNECLTMTINTGVLSTTPVTYTSTVNIYPNPANDQITIDCGNLDNVVGWNIKITNMLGQEVFNQPMNTQQYVVPLNTWSGQGMYFVKIINAQNEVVNIKKIILQ